MSRFCITPFARRLLTALLWLTGLAYCAATYALPPDTQGDVGYTYDDNVSRGSGVYQKSDSSFFVDVKQALDVPIAEHYRIVLTGSLGSELYINYRGLSYLSGAGQGELQYRSSAEYGTPLFALFTRLTAEQYQSGMRDGFRYTLGASMKQTLTDRIRIFAALSHNARSASNSIFSTSDNALRFNLDYTPAYAATLYLGGEYRQGNTVISGPQSWNAWNSASAPDDVFSGWSTYSFKLDGTTTSLTAGYNWAIAPRQSVDFSWRRINSSVDYYTTTTWNKSSVSYTTNQYSVAFLARF